MLVSLIPVTPAELSFILPEVILSPMPSMYTRTPPTPDQPLRFMNNLVNSSPHPPEEILSTMINMCSKDSPNPDEFLRTMTSMVNRPLIPPSRRISEYHALHEF